MWATDALARSGIERAPDGRREFKQWGLCVQNLSNLPGSNQVSWINLSSWSVTAGGRPGYPAQVVLG